MKFGLTFIGAMLLAGSVGLAQTRVDLPTLERKIQDAQTAMERADSTTADEREFRDLEDEVAYLRVKTRKGESVTDRDRRDLNDRIDRFMGRMRTREAGGSWTRPNRGGGTTARDRDTTYGRDTTSGRDDRVLPAGSEMDVRLQTRLYSDTAQVEDPVEASTVVDISQGDRVLIPAGSLLTGYVSSVDRASRTDRKGSLTVEFTRLSVNGRTYDVRAHVVQTIESEGIKGEAGRIGAGAGVGAIIGGILGGVKGAITGILIGSGGVLVATEGKDVDLPPGTILRVRFEDLVRLTE